jgi:putative DNA primase/helicase
MQIKTATYNRFLVLPPHAAVLFAVWSLHSYIFDVFSFTPYLHITSPEKECGKSTLAELMNHLCNLATTPGGMTAASMFRRIERLRPTLLLDEWDTLSEDTRLAALNVLNTGFKWNGVYTICVGDDHDDRDFHTFCPKAIFGLSAAKLPDTTRSRCFPVMLQKKLPRERIEKLTRKFDGSILRRKCLRWANDHREELSKREPVMPDGLSARQEDISEPLLAIAEACGGIWPDAVRQAILHFCGQAKTDESDAKHELLKDIQESFRKQAPADRFSSAAMRDYLNGLEDRQWGGWNEGKGISQRQIADRLRSYRIASRSVRLADGKVARGYYLADFQDIFDRYLAPEGFQSATSATNPVNIEQNPLFQSATDGNRSERENHDKPLEIKDCSTVADEKPKSGLVEANELIEADLL